MTSPVENAANKNVKVLIADDEPINLQVLTNQLALEGFNVVSVSDGQSVIDYLNREQYDLLIIDIMMPNMSGYEVCRRLRERYTLTELPILMLTAKNQVHDIVTAFEVGANDYLTKPCDRRELISRVETLILLRQANAELIRINPMNWARPFHSFIAISRRFKKALLIRMISGMRQWYRIVLKYWSG